MDQKELMKWVESVGGPIKATLLIQQCLECSVSKAEKMATGRYPSLPTPAEQKVLSKMMKRSRNKLFAVVTGEALEDSESA
jgi:hypothetical protein